MANIKNSLWGWFDEDKNILDKIEAPVGRVLSSAHLSCAPIRFVLFAGLRFAIIGVHRAYEV